VKFIYSRLPPHIHHTLAQQKFVRWIRGLPSLSRRDLSWKDFSAQVLVERNSYKGVFIQEAVIDWNDPLFQRPQHIATALGRLGYLVVYKTFNRDSDNVDGFREVSKNVWLTNKNQVNKLENAVRLVCSTDFTHTPNLLRSNLGKGLLIYDYIDRIDPQISGVNSIQRLIALKDFAFSGGVDFILASARQLEAEAVAAVGRDKVILIQNGVDTGHYRDPIHETTHLSPDFVAFKNQYLNVVGYFGALAPWLWYEVIAELVEKRKDIGFVFIGPSYAGGVDQLPTSENVLYLGVVEYNVLPAYGRQFDVCIIPFAPGEIARTTSPLKLFEYFALEKPVVVTSEMVECVAFKEVFSGDSTKTISQAIDKAITVKADMELKARLAQLADENGWDERVRNMEQLFTQLTNLRD
jgi:glycosyltransferase involved in cell wall biosynthesis